MHLFLYLVGTISYYHAQSMRCTDNTRTCYKTYP